MRSTTSCVLILTLHLCLLMDRLSADDLTHQNVEDKSQANPKTKDINDKDVIKEIQEGEAPLPLMGQLLDNVRQERSAPPLSAFYAVRGRKRASNIPDTLQISPAILELLGYRGGQSNNRKSFTDQENRVDPVRFAPSFSYPKRMPSPGFSAVRGKRQNVPLDGVGFAPGRASDAAFSSHRSARSGYYPRGRNSIGDADDVFDESIQETIPDKLYMQAMRHLAEGGHIDDFKSINKRSGNWHRSI